MNCRIALLSAMVAVLCPVQPVDAARCTYKVARDFRNFLTETSRFRVTTGDVIEFLFETEDTLVRRNDKTNAILPGLAKAWEYDADSQSFIFTLNRNCAWSDGYPLVADDFVDGFQELYSHGATPNVGGSSIAGAKEIIANGAPPSALQVEALADDKVRIGIVGDPSVALMYLTYISYSPLPSHVPNAEHVPMVSPRRRFIGPFKVSSVEKDMIVLDRNPYYCSDQKIDIDRIELLNRKEGYWEFSEFISDRLDMVRYPPEKQLHMLRTYSDESVSARVELINERRQTYLLLNPMHSGFANAEIRKKLFFALDYKSLVERGNSFTDVRRVASTLFYDLPGYENYRYPSVTESYPEGIFALRKTMEKYGYSNEHPLKAIIITYPLERFDTMARMLSSMLRQAHFEISVVKSMSVSEVVSHGRAGRYDMYFLSWILDYSDPQSSLDGLLNAMGFLLMEENAKAHSPELNQQFIQPMQIQLAQLKKSNNRLDRFKTLQAIEKLIIDSALVIPVYTELSTILVSAKIMPLDGSFPHTRVLKLRDCEQQHPIKQPRGL